VVAGWLRAVPLPVVAANADGIAFVAVTAAIAFATLVLGELAPKNLAIVHSEGIALRVARPIELLSKISAPLIWILTASTGLIMRLTGTPERARVPPITEEEILAMVASGEEEGAVAPAERNLIGEVFDFGETTADEVMVPRVDIRALPKEATLADTYQVVRETGHNRLPVYDGSLDHIIGVVHVLALLQHLGPGATEAQANQPVTTIMRPAYFIPESKRVTELLAELQRQELHLAIVVDEFGGTAGIVTLNDILEELVGPISDEFGGHEEPEIQHVNEGEAVVSGAADLDDLGAALGIDLDFQQVDTVGGLVSARLGRIPKEGDVARLPQAIVEVLSMRGPRVLKARITRREKPTEAGSTTS
jgi:putative hemolysin